MTTLRQFSIISFQQLTTSSEGTLLDKMSTWIETVSTILFLLERRSSSEIKIVFFYYLLVICCILDKKYLKLQENVETEFEVYFLKHLKQCVLNFQPILLKLQSNCLCSLLGCSTCGMIKGWSAQPSVKTCHHFVLSVCAYVPIPILWCTYGGQSTT